MSQDQRLSAVSLNAANPKAVAFGPFRFDEAHRLLTHQGVPVPLGDRAFDILQVLIAHAPNVVSKATIFEQVWPGTSVEESTLRFQMWGLRKALGDGEGGNRYISTVSGRGYCFVAELLSEAAGNIDDGAVPVSGAPPPQPAPANPPTRILIVDDHPFLREGLKAVLRPQGDVTVVGEADDGAKAVSAFEALQPDITLMDLQMPNVDGVAAITAIRRDHPKARIIVLTTYGGDVQALRALKAGAAGYLLKSAARKELVDAIHAVRAGRRYLPPDIATDIAIHAIDDSLTGSEVAILKLIAVGQADKQIADRLGIPEDTVRSHLQSIFEKLDVEDRTHAATVAVRRGIIDLR